MDVESAIQFVKGVVYKPRWRISAEQHDRFENTIRLCVEFIAPDSDKRHAPEYDSISYPCPHFAIMLDGLDAAGLAREVFKCILDAEHHEMREFFSVRTDEDPYFKLYHPHTMVGMHMWASLNNAETDAEVEASVYRDLMYGNA